MFFPYAKLKTLCLACVVDHPTYALTQEGSQVVPYFKDNLIVFFAVNMVCSSPNEYQINQSNKYLTVCAFIFPFFFFLLHISQSFFKNQTFREGITHISKIILVLVITLDNKIQAHEIRLSYDLALELASIPNLFRQL